MAIKTIQVITDDLDGTELPTDTKPIRLSYASTTVDLHLSEKNASKLEKALAPYLEAGTKVTNSTRRSSRSTGPKASDVRQWARENNIDVPERGRIPADVIAAYEAS